MGIKNRTLQPPTSMQKLTINLPKIFVREESAIIKATNQGFKERSTDVTQITRDTATEI